MADMERDPGYYDIERRMRNPLGLDWSQPLQDPAWRRWFDIIKEMNVSGFGPTTGGGLGVSRPAYEAVPDPEHPGTTMPERRTGYSIRSYEEPVASSGAPIRGLKRLYTKGY